MFRENIQESGVISSDSYSGISEIFSSKGGGQRFDKGRKIGRLLIRILRKLRNVLPLTSIYEKRIVLGEKIQMKSMVLSVWKKKVTSLLQYHFRISILNKRRKTERKNSKPN